MFIFDCMYIGLEDEKTYVALVMVVFIIAIYYYDYWRRFVLW